MLIFAAVNDESTYYGAIICKYYVLSKMQCLLVREQRKLIGGRKAKNEAISILVTAPIAIPIK